MRSAPAGSSVNAHGLMIAYGIPLSRIKSSPCHRIGQFKKMKSRKVDFTLSNYGLQKKKKTEDKDNKRIE